MSSSVAALLIGSGAPPALAACVVINAPFDNPALSTIQCVQLNGATIAGNISNEGTITGTSSGAISLAAGIITGQITDSGVISGGGIVIDPASAITGSNPISITGPTFVGGITNAGTLTATVQGGDGIVVFQTSTFTDGIVNTGTITGGLNGNGIAVIDVPTFTGGVSNNGTVSGAAAILVTGFGDATTFAGGVTNTGTVQGNLGIGVLGIAQFSGGVSNAGTITAIDGIQADNAIFADGITNSGTISASHHGIEVAASLNHVTITGFSGGIVNAGTITAGQTAIAVTNVATFTGNLTNSGTLSAASGIVVKGSTITGSVIDTGIVLATSRGISIDSASTINSTQVGVGIAGATFTGGLANAGTIAAAHTAIALVNVATFTGNVTNSGTLSGPNGIIIVGSTVTGAVVDSGNVLATTHGIAIDHASAVTASRSSIAITGPTFTGGVMNAGTVTATAIGGNAIDVFQTSTFTGGIANTGTIAAALNGNGIAVNNVPTFTGGVSNGGTVSAGAAAILVTGFGNASTFAGGVVNAGLLQGNAGIDVGGVTQFSGGILNVATIAARSGIAVDAAVFTGGITNAGTITGSGSGIKVAVSVGGLTMTSFSGGIVNIGTIATANRAISISGLPTFVGDISNAGTLSAASGIVIGSGVTFAGGGAIMNSGTVTGTTAAIDVSAATSPVVIDQIAGQITGAIDLSANADTLNISGGAISGNVVGQGNGTVNFTLGAGTFTYAGPFAMTALGQVNFNSGTVFVDGSIGGNAINVNTGGTAAGTGTLAGAVTVASGGTLMPGAPLGTLNVTGSVTFNAGSIYAVHITPSTSSATNITGAPGIATINGGTVTVTLQPGHYNATQYAIIATTGGVSGTFSALSVNGRFTGSMTLDYSNPNDVMLDVGAGATQFTAPPGANQNQQNVINGLNNALLAGDTLPPAFANLATLSDGALLNALTQLSGQNSAGFFQGTFQAGNSFLGLMVNPFVDGRFGSGLGPAIGFAPDAPPALPQAAAAFASAMPEKAPPPTFDQRFNAWGAAYGGSGNVRGDPVVGSSATTASVAAFAAGIDYRASADTSFGFALAGGGTSWSLDASLGGGRSDFFQAGLYGSHRWGNAYLSGALAYNFHDVTTNRTVTVAGTDMLQARFLANGVGARLEGGYRYATPWLGVTPYAAAQVQSIALPSYSESATAGSNQFALSFASQTATTTRTEIGTWLDRTTLLGRDARMTLYGRLAWAHDFGDTPNASPIFQALPGSNFVVNGAAPARDGGLVTAGAKYALPSGWSFTAKFDGEFSSTTSIYSGSGIVQKTW